MSHIMLSVDSLICTKASGSKSRIPWAREAAKSYAGTSAVSLNWKPLVILYSALSEADIPLAYFLAGGSSGAGISCEALFASIS